MKRPTYVCLVPLAACLLFGIPHASHGVNLAVNGDFLAGFEGWEREGNTFLSGGAGALSDDSVSRSLLFQGVFLDAGTYEVGFAFRNLLAMDFLPGFAADSFFVSLYFSTTPELFDPVGFSGFDSAVSLLDLDAGGASAAYGGEIVPGGGAGFFVYANSFTIAGSTTVFPVFDLFNLNGVSGDSLVLLDDVRIVIPEPGAGVWIAGLLAALLCLRRKRS